MLAQPLAPLVGATLAAAVVVAGCADEEASPGPDPVSATTVAAAAGSSPLPTPDAAALRDELLDLAARTDVDGELSAGTAIISRWLAEHPGLQLSLFDDQPATEEVVSSSTAFLIASPDSPVPEVAGEQHFAFAVLDTSGRCAGGIAVIPGEADGSVADDGRPTEFAPVATPASDCSAAATSALYGAR